MPRAADLSQTRPRASREAARAATSRIVGMVAREEAECRGPAAFLKCSERSSQRGRHEQRQEGNLGSDAAPHARSVGEARAHFRGQTPPELALATRSGDREMDG